MKGSLGPKLRPALSVFGTEKELLSAERDSPWLEPADDMTGEISTGDLHKSLKYLLRLRKVIIFFLSIEGPSL